MQIRRRATTSIAVALALLAGLAATVVPVTPAGAVAGPTATITYADGTTSKTGVAPGDEIAVDLTITNCTNSNLGNFTLQAASERWTTFPVGPTWMNGTTYGPTWPKITDSTGLTDGTYRLYFTMPDLGDGPHTLRLGWLQGVNCFMSGAITDTIDLYQGTPTPTTTAPPAPVATPSIVSMSPSSPTTADTLTFHLSVAGNLETPGGWAGVGFFAPNDPNWVFNTGCMLNGGECDATVSASLVASQIGTSFDVKPFYNGSLTYGYVLGGATNYTLSEPPTTTVPPTTVPETPPTTVPETPSTTVPETPSTTVPRTSRRPEPRTPRTTVPSSPSTTTPRRSVACPERRPYRIYSDRRSQSLGAALVANCRYRSEWRRQNGERAQFVVPTGWVRDRRIPGRWWD